MKAILSADRNWGIGCQNKLLISIPSDMKFFRETTTGHVVVMGRKTLESFPGKQPLKNRVNIVLTRDVNYQAAPCVVMVHSLEELLQELKKYARDEVYVIGGGAVYQLLLPYCDTVYVTRIDFAYQADTWFPNLDQDEDWELAEESEEHTCFDIEYCFARYVRKSLKQDR